MSETYTYRGEKTEQAETPALGKAELLVQGLGKHFGKDVKDMQVKTVFMDSGKGGVEAGMEHLIYGNQGAINIIASVGEEAFQTQEKKEGIPLVNSSGEEAVNAYRAQLKEALVASMPELKDYQVFYGKLKGEIVIRILPPGVKESGTFTQVFGNTPKEEKKESSGSAKQEAKNAQATLPEAKEQGELGPMAKTFLDDSKITWVGQKRTCAKTAMACIEPLGISYNRSMNLAWVPNVVTEWKRKETQEGKTYVYTKPEDMHALIQDPSKKLLVILDHTYAGEQDHIGIKEGGTFFEMRGGKRKVSGETKALVASGKVTPDGYDIVALSDPKVVMANKKAKTPHVSAVIVLPA